MHHHVSVVSAAEGIRPDPPLCAAVHAAAAAAAAATGTARRPASVPSAEAAVNLRGVFYYFFVLFSLGGKKNPAGSEISGGEARSGPSLLMHSSLFSLEQ